MNNLSESREFRKLKPRILRMYGMQRITVTQHNAAMGLCNLLEAALSNEQDAERIVKKLDMVKLLEEVEHASS